MSARLREIISNSRFTAAQCVDCAKPVFTMDGIRCAACTGTCHSCGADIDPDLTTCDSCSRDEYAEPRTQRDDE